MGPNVRDLFCQGEKSESIAFNAQPIGRGSQHKDRSPELATHNS